MKRIVEDGISLLAGAGIGVVAMYLLDPESGPARRRLVAERAREKIQAAEEAVAPVITTAADRVGDFGRRLAHTAADYGAEITESGRRYMSDAGESIADETHGLTERVSDFGRSLVSRGRSIMPRAWRPRRKRAAIPMLPGAIGGIGLIALGVGATYFFDPVQGRARRARVRDTSFRALNETGDFFRKAGRRIANQFRGGYYRTAGRFRADQPADQQLCARVRSQLGHVVNDMSGLQVIADRGYVTIWGAIPQSDIDSAINMIMRVPGVRGVNHQLRPQQTAV